MPKKLYGHIFSDTIVGFNHSFQFQKLMNGQELASGNDNSRTPWATIGENPYQFFDRSFVPDGFRIQDPSRMGANVKILLGHLRERQEELGVNAFHFHHILRNNKIEPAEYPPSAQVVIDAGPGAKNWPLGDGDKDTSSDVATPEKTSVKKSLPKKSSTKKSAKKRTAEEMSTEEKDVKVAEAESFGDGEMSSAQRLPFGSVPPTETNPPDTNSQSAIPNFQMSMQYYPQYQQNPWTQFPAGFPMPNSQPPESMNTSAVQPHPSMPPYPFTFNPHYYGWNQQRPDIFSSRGPADNCQPQLKSDPTFGNIDPLLLPPGQPIFGDISRIHQVGKKASSTKPKKTVPEVTFQPPTWTPTPVKKTPQKKRPIEVTPSRSQRPRKPSRRVLDSLDAEMD
jgi:hypothetical protein